MAGFSSFQSSYKSEVDQILAEAMDHSVLEQVAAINCSSFSDSVLPSHIEKRFQKLKTFPSFSSSKPLDKPQLAPDSANESKNSVSGHQLPRETKGQSSDGEGKSAISPSGHSKVSNFEENLGGAEGKMGNSPHGHSKVSNFERRSGNRKGKKGNSQKGCVSSPSDSSSGHMDSPKLNVGKHGEKGKMGNSKPGSSSFCSDSEEEIEGKSGGGCLCFSPKRISGKKKKNGGGGGSGSGGKVGGELGFGWGKDEELLSDLRSFSSKEQKKRMKEAIKEEEKINKEAEKIVKWAKQVSARMDFDISDDDDDALRDEHSEHHFGPH